jgi:hypothetical protein
MSLSSISWHIGLLVGSSSPVLPITPSPKEWLALVGSTVGSHCRSEPHQECVAGEIPTSWTTSPRRRQRLVQNSSSRSRSSGVNSTRPRLSATDHARVRVVPWVGWVLMVVSPWSPRSADVTTIRCPRLGVPQGGAGLDRGLSRHGNGPDGLGVSGSMGRCPPDHVPAAGTGHHPTRMISRRPRPGRVSPPKAVVSSPRATDGNLRLDSMVRAASKARTRWLLTCGFRCPAEDPRS